jgi:hypothetical protein
MNYLYYGWSKQSKNGQSFILVMSILHMDETLGTAEATEVFRENKE